MRGGRKELAWERLGIDVGLEVGWLIVVGNT